MPIVAGNRLQYRENLSAQREETITGSDANLTNNSVQQT